MINFEERVLKQVVIDKILLSTRVAITKEMLMNLSVKKCMDYLSGDVAYQFDLYLNGKEYKYESTKTVKTLEVPISWWQHFKKDIFPKWLLKKFPPKFNPVSIIEKTEVHTTKICPHLITDPQQEHVTFLIYEPKSKAKGRE